MKFPVYNQQGEQVKEIALPKRLFSVVIKPEVIHQVVVAQQANSRQVLAHTKTKSEVSGGGKKPWKQKGTGRARHGSSRSPIWIGGGVTFGPRSDRNFSVKVNKKQKQVALAMCLSELAKNKGLVIFEQLNNEAGKTKDFSGWLKTAKSKVAELKDSKKYLLLTADRDEKLIRSVKNLKNVSVISAKSLNCVDLLKHDSVLMAEKSVELIDKHYHQIREKVVESK
jgi:large subunit ribosomal protein L4